MSRVRYGHCGARRVGGGSTPFLNAVGGDYSLAEASEHALASHGRIRRLLDAAALEAVLV